MAEQKKMKVVLLRHTLSPEEAIALGAKLCYSKSSISDLQEKISAKDQTGFIEKLMDMTDLVMLDIKHIDDEMHKKLTGHTNKNILELAKYLSDIKKPVWIRHVLVPEWTDKDEYLLSNHERTGTETLFLVAHVQQSPVGNQRDGE